MKKILVLIVLTVVIFASLFAYILINKSSKGLSEEERNAALSKLLGRKLNLTEKTSQKEYIEYKGKYVSFVYPKDATPFDEQNKPEGAYYSKTSLDGFVFSLQNPFIWVSVQVSPNTSGTNNLEDYSGVRVRQLDPQSYIQSEIFAREERGLLFDKFNISSGTEKTAFFLVNGKIYTVFIQGNNKEDIANLFNKIISSLKFL